MLLTPGLFPRKRIITAAAPSGIAFIGSVEAAGGQASPQTTAAMDTTGANLLVCAVSAFAGVAEPTVTDSKGNSWTPKTGFGSNSGRVRLHFSVPTSVGAGHTFEASNASDMYGTIIAMAFSGANSSPFDNENGDGNDVGVSSTQPGSLTPSQNNSLIIAACSPADQGAFPYGVDSSFIEANEVEGVLNTIEGLIAAYLIQGSAAAVNPTFSWTNNVNPGAAIAAFKPA